MSQLSDNWDMANVPLSQNRKRLRKEVVDFKTNKIWYNTNEKKLKIYNTKIGLLHWS